MACQYKIRQINIIGIWSYDSINSDCPVCKINLQNIPDILIKPSKPHRNNFIRNSVQIGLCGHGVHSKCIEQWLESNANCPVCVSTSSAELIWKTNQTIEPDIQEQKQED